MTSDAGKVSDFGSLRSRVMKGGFFLFGRQVLSIGLKFIGVLLVTRILGPDKYGAYVAGLGIYQYVLALGQAGVGIYLIRLNQEITEEHYKTASAVLAALSLSLMMAVEALSGLLSEYVGIDGFREVIQISVVALPLQILSVPAMCRIERALDYRSVALVEVVAQVVYYAVAVPLVFFDHGATALAYAWIVQQFATVVLSYVCARRFPSFGFRIEIAKEMLRYSVSFSAANWIWQARTLVNPLVVGPNLGAYSVGMIGMTVGILEMLSIIKTIGWRLSLSVLARVQDQPERLRKAVTQGMELQTFSVGSILLCFSWFGPWIVPAIFGERWLPVLDLYPFVALAYLTMALFNIHSATLSVLHLNYRLVVYHAVHVLSFALAATLLVPSVHVIGYGLAEMAALPSYLFLHSYLRSAIGSPDYRVAAMWWIAVAIGLSWRMVGVWAIAVPILTLFVPASARRLSAYWALVFASNKRRSASEFEAP